MRLGDLSDRLLAVDPRTGTTTIELWPPDRRPVVEEIHDIDDWLAVIGTGRCVGVTAENTLTQVGTPLMVRSPAGLCPRHIVRTGEPNLADSRGCRGRVSAATGP